MSKKFKRLSAVILAVVMMLGSTVMAHDNACLHQRMGAGNK